MRPSGHYPEEEKKISIDKKQQRAPGSSGRSGRLGKKKGEKTRSYQFKKTSGGKKAPLATQGRCLSLEHTGTKKVGVRTSGEVQKPDTGQKKCGAGRGRGQGKDLHPARKRGALGGAEEKKTCRGGKGGGGNGPRVKSWFIQETFELTQTPQLEEKSRKGEPNAAAKGVRQNMSAEGHTEKCNKKKKTGEGV